MMQLTRRTALFGAAGLAACGQSAPAPASLADVVLRVATYRGGVHTHMEAAGLADTPYRVAYSEFAGGNFITEAINARAIDLGSMSEIPPIFVAGTQPLMRIVAVQRADVNAQVILVPEHSRIAAPADLRGKRVGYVRATTSHFLLMRYLSEAGLGFADITPIALMPQDGLAAFERGELDAWVIYGVQGSLARARVHARVLATGLGRLSGNYVWSALNESTGDPHKRAAIVDYLKRVQQLWAWTDANPEEYAALSAAATGAPASIYLQQHAERSGPTQIAPVDDAAIQSQQNVADAFAEAGLIPARVNVRPLWSAVLNDALS